MTKPKESKMHKSIPSSICDSKRILQAISILKQLNHKFYETKEKKSLLDDESENPIILQLTMKKIPPVTMQKYIKVLLPTPIHNDNNEVCLITGDVDKVNTKSDIEPDVLHFKGLLKRENISQVNEVITLRQLRKEYKPFEARRQLCGAYDVFLCDKKIAGVLPHTLGKSFFKKRKLPIQINMQTSNLKEQIEQALSTTVFHITCKGNSCASEVANLSMDGECILSNVEASINALKEQLPGQLDNILGIYVKTPKSKAIPLYLSESCPNDFNFSMKRTRSKFVTAELSTLDDSEVKVFRDGRVIVKKPKIKHNSKVPTESLEEDSSNEIMVKHEAEDSSLFPGTDGEVANNGSEIVKKIKKKSKKLLTNLGSDDESPEVEIETKPVKISNKRKQNAESEVEIAEENVTNSIISMIGKLKKKKKNKD